MHVTYDSKYDVLCIRFGRGTANTVFDESKGVALDYDAEGHLLGIEVLDTRLHFGDLDILKELTFEELGGTQPS